MRKKLVRKPKIKRDDVNKDDGSIPCRKCHNPISRALQQLYPGGYCENCWVDGQVKYDGRSQNIKTMTTPEHPDGTKFTTKTR